MDREYIDMYLLTDRYLLGALSEHEKAGFEERLIWDHELVDEVELAERLQRGLQECSGNRRRADHEGFGISGWLSGLLSKPQYAAVASFLLAVTFLNPFTSNDKFPATTHTEIVPLMAVRGADTQTIVVDNHAWMVLLVDVSESHETFRVTVRKDDASAETVWREVGLLPTYQDSLAVGMPANTLATGHYVLTLEGMRTAEANSKNNYEHLQSIRFQTAE